MFKLRDTKYFLSRVVCEMLKLGSGVTPNDDKHTERLAVGI